MARERRTFAKLHHLTVVVTAQNLHFLERQAEYFGFSVAELTRRILCDVEG